jgi:rhodanese-related sulfurtransferase
VPEPAVDAVPHRARARLDRVAPADLADEVAAGALVVDIRPAADRAADGELPGAEVVERIHLEWRLDPTSPHRIAGTSAGRRVIVVCNEGYASSLAAAALQDLGLPHATDLTGGYRTWRAWQVLTVDASVEPSRSAS